MNNPYWGDGGLSVSVKLSNGHTTFGRLECTDWETINEFGEECPIFVITTPQRIELKPYSDFDGWESVDII